jgi:hypothetical protein
MLQTLVQKCVDAVLQKSGRCIEISTTSAGWRWNWSADPQLNRDEAWPKLTAAKGTMAIEDCDRQEWCSAACSEQCGPG